MVRNELIGHNIASSTHDVQAAGILFPLVVRSAAGRLVRQSGGASRAVACFPGALPFFASSGAAHWSCTKDGNVAQMRQKLHASVPTV